jgi:hypothetical protein
MGTNGIDGFGQNFGKRAVGRVKSKTKTNVNFEPAIA